MNGTGNGLCFIFKVLTSQVSIVIYNSVLYFEQIMFYVFH